MNESWYTTVSADTALSQGDIIIDCPLVTWNRTIAVTERNDSDYESQLDSLIYVEKADVIVMSQACDLEQNKVRDVVLCPHVSLTDHKSAWNDASRASGQNPTDNAWRNHCSKIKQGFVWNLSMLNSSSGSPASDVRIVDFHDVFTLPRSFIEPFVKCERVDRLRLLPPYREHLSQSFARYFMRVGLPVSVQLV